MTTLKELLFGEGLMSPTISGDKLITLRRYRKDAHDFLKGEIVRGIFKDGLTILLRITADTEVKPFDELTDGEARQDGFADAAAAFEGLKTYYPDLKRSDLAATIRYEVFSVDGARAVEYNEHAG